MMNNLKNIELVSILPEITLVLGIFLIILLGLLLKRLKLAKFYNNIALFVAVIACLFVINLYDFLPILSFNTMLENNFLIVSFKSVIMIFALFTLFLSSGSAKNYPDVLKFEYPILILFSLIGILIMLSAVDLISLYMGLELQSLCLYVLAAFDRDNLRSSEAGVKYFVLGSIASALLLFGMSFIYGYTGTTNFILLKALYSDVTAGAVVPLAVIIGMVLIIIGFCFKVAAVPFHVWSPDVYEGSQLPVTAFFAVIPKIAAIYVITKLLLVNFGFWADIWQQVIKLVAVLSMFIGAFSAIQQRNIKRLLAYSSISHVGFILSALATNEVTAVNSIIIYTIIYGIITIGIFALINLLEVGDERNYNISIFKGLGKNHPILSFSFAVLLLSMAGIPPLAGFFAKFYIISNIIKSQMYGLASLFLIASVISVYYYLKIIRLMYFEIPENSYTKCNYNIETVSIATISVTLNILLVFTPSAIINFSMINLSYFIR